MSSRPDFLKGSIISHIFQGTISSFIRCCSCGDVSKKTDPFLDMSLNIPDSIFLEKLGDGGFGYRSCSLIDCLRKFCAGENLKYSELYRCSKCLEMSEAVKTMRFCQLPEILCVHLKRFRWGESSYSKVSTPVEYPFDLDLSPFCCEDLDFQNCHYMLSAVIQHHGLSANHGHYTAFVRNIEEKVWIHYDDRKVRIMQSDEMFNVQAYLLFYTKCVVAN